MQFNFDTIHNRQNTESVKWNIYDEDVLPMWVADMDFRSPDAVIQALRERVNHGIFGYPTESKELKKAVIAWLDRRHGWEVSPQDIIFLPGVVTGFNLAAHTVSQAGDGVLIQTPTYGPFLRVAHNMGLIQQEMELTRGPDGQYTIDMDAFESTITERTSVFMLCNPQNPTGRVFRKDELEALAEICLCNDVLICSDEIHSDLVFSESKHIPIASLDAEIATNTITLLAPSKSFNIAGLKASVAIVQNKDLREKFEGERRGLVGWVNLLGRIAMQAAYAEGESWLDALLKYLEFNRDYVFDFVQNELSGVSMAKPEGTYLAWLDCRGTEMEEKPNQFFLQKARVAMNAGEWFGRGGEGYVRFNFGCPRATIEIALNRMKDALEIKRS
ncbi:MAG: MalY/PatB family protein [Chloroflexota bacterium]|nr:MalY/PatB family protein [Chloroflexota bacterium]